MAEVVYSDVGPNAPAIGRLFQGKKFWLSRLVPCRNRYMDMIRANGGEIVLSEKAADILIADPLRKGIPPGSYSFTYIEQSVKKGRLEDLELHPVGRPVGRPREVGSLSQPVKRTRTPYTAEDERILTEWVRSNRVKGTAEAGNELYKELERKVRALSKS